jgi:hypothetical protein
MGGHETFVAGWGTPLLINAGLAQANRHLTI